MEAMQLAGKLNHYSNLVGGQFERCLIIHLVKDKASKKEELTIGKQARTQMVWWLLNLRALELEGALIPDPDEYFNWEPWCCIQMQQGEQHRTLGRVGDVAIQGRRSMQGGHGRLTS